MSRPCRRRDSTNDTSVAEMCKGSPYAIIGYLVKDMADASLVRRRNHVSVIAFSALNIPPKIIRQSPEPFKISARDSCLVFRALAPETMHIVLFRCHAHVTCQYNHRRWAARFSSCYSRLILATETSAALSFPGEGAGTQQASSLADCVEPGFVNILTVKNHPAS